MCHLLLLNTQSFLWSIWLKTNTLFSKDHKELNLFTLLSNHLLNIHCSTSRTFWKWLKCESYLRWYKNVTISSHVLIILGHYSNWCMTKLQITKSQEGHSIGMLWFALVCQMLTLNAWCHNDQINLEPLLAFCFLQTSFHVSWKIC